jgi:hypothetical protein
VSQDLLIFLVVLMTCFFDLLNVGAAPFCASLISVCGALFMCNNGLFAKKASEGPLAFLSRNRKKIGWLLLIAGFIVTFIFYLETLELCSSCLG